jgi:fatty acid kinase fatty acid binding subunit
LTFWGASSVRPAFLIFASTGLPPLHFPSVLAKIKFLINHLKEESAMPDIALVTDSTVNMADDWLKRYDITVVPVYVNFGNNSFKDYVEIPPAEFYKRLAGIKAAGGELPKTSQPSPADFERAYSALARSGAKHIISVHVAANSSGTVNSALIAKDMVGQKAQVHVVDSATTSMHMGYMLIEAAAAIREGGGAQDALDAIEKVKANSCLYFTVTELEHLGASGRTVGADKVAEAEIKVRPVIGLINGKPTVVSPERTQRGAIDKVFEFTRNRLQGLRLKGVTVVHANALDRAEALKARLPAELGYNGEVVITDFGPALAVHFGPGMLGLAAYGE